jgi:hypothetical protein
VIVDILCKKIKIKYTAMKKLTYKLAGLMMALAIIFSALDISIAQKEKIIQGNTTLELNRKREFNICSCIQRFPVNRN